jgi:hypothetical protein
MSADTPFPSKPSHITSRRRLRLFVSVAAFALVALAANAGPAAATPACPISYGSSDTAKPNKVYLYFPAVADASYPGVRARAKHDLAGGGVQRRQPDQLLVRRDRICHS